MFLLLLLIMIKNDYDNNDNTIDYKGAGGGGQNYNKWNLWLNGDVKHFISVNLKKKIRGCCSCRFVL